MISDMYKIFGKENCGYCKRAKDLLSSEGLEYKYLEKDVDYDKETLVDMVSTDNITYPQVFKGNQLIGGYDDLLEHLI